ncbi:MAG: mechanosensitive ion channel family protein, partial [Actinomycetota bacterium]|nr:mechanosensitive ion channel family protein [Actinomycetota bacterium]
MELWQRLLAIVVVLAIAALLARTIDRRILGRDRGAEALTRYRVLRRTISVSIVSIGLLSALLVIPQVRAIAGGLLASSAILGLIIGFASQRTLGNFVAGLM